MISMRSGFVVVGCVLVGYVTSAGSGLVARAAEPPRWVPRAITPSDSTNVPASEAERRIAQLEQRLQELEAERRAASPSARPTRSDASDELDALMARNSELMARNRTLTVENQALAQNHLFETPVSATACEPPQGDADPKAQLRYWAERLRDGDHGFRDGLTIEQNTALNVLLRRERALDPRNPWQEL